MHLIALIRQCAARRPDAVALCRHDAPEASLTYGELAERVSDLAAVFVEDGIAPGDRIAVLGEPGPAMAVALLAILAAGAIAVPLDPRLGREGLRPVLNDAKPVLLLVSRKATSTIGTPGGAGLARMRVRPLESLVAAPGPAAHSVTWPGCRLQQPALLTYSSGTTGTPKGVLTTLGNIAIQVRGFHQLMGTGPGDVFLSILPLSHLFELVIGLFGVLYSGGRVCYLDSLLPADLTTAMKDQRVTRMLVVPLFLQLLRRSIDIEAAAGPRWQQLLFRCSITVAPRLAHPRRRLLFRPLHRTLGGSLRSFICGGAPLEDSLLDFFENLGFEVYQGYGTTETSPVITTNAPGSNRAGTVGRPYRGIEVCIQGTTGEILTRGPHVMAGYFGRPELTAAVIDRDGWLHTGDRGCIDQDGFLRVTGRCSNLIVLGSGKKVQPEPLEPLLFDHADILEGCLLGCRSEREILSRRGIFSGSEEVCALVVPSPAVRERFRDRTSQLEKHLKQLIESRSEALADWQRPTRILILADTLPKTATGKVRRGELRRWLETEAAA